MPGIFPEIEQGAVVAARRGGPPLVLAAIRHFSGSSLISPPKLRRKQRGVTITGNVDQFLTCFLSCRCLVGRLVSLNTPENLISEQYVFVFFLGRRRWNAG